MMNRAQVEAFMNNIGNPLAIEVEDPHRLTEDGARQVQGVIRLIETQYLPDVETQLAEAKENQRGFIEGRRPDRKDGFPPRDWDAMWAAWEKETGSKLRTRIEHLKAKRDRLADALRIRSEAIAKAEADSLEKMARGLPEKAKALQDAATAKPELVKATLDFADALGGQSLEDVVRPILSAEARMKDIQTQRRFLIEKGIPVKDIPEAKAPEGLRKAVQNILGRKIEGVDKRNHKWRRIEADQIAADKDAAALAKYKG